MTISILILTLSCLAVGAWAVEARSAMPPPPRVAPADLGLEPLERTRGWPLAVDPRWQRVGEGSFERAADGAVLLAFDAREHLGDIDRSRILVARSADGGRVWSEAETLLADPEASILQPSLRRLGNGDLGMTYSRLHDARRAEKLFVRSADDGRTWSDPVLVSGGESSYVTGPHDRLFRLASGRLISLIHAKVGAVSKQHGEGRLASFVVLSDDDGASWRNATPEGMQAPDARHARLESGYWEPSLVEHGPDQLLMMARTTTGWLWQARSEDGGVTWSAPEASAIPNPLAPPCLLRAPGSDELLLFHNPQVEMDAGWHAGHRNCLVVRRSSDGGRSWSAPRAIEYLADRERWFDYPHGLWLDDGSLLLGYRCPIGQPRWRSVEIRFQRLRPKDWR